MNLMSLWYSSLSSNSSRKYLIHLLSFQNTVAFVKPIRLLFSWQRFIFLFQAPAPKKWILSRYLVANTVLSDLMCYRCFAPGGAVAPAVNDKSPALSCPLLPPGSIKHEETPWKIPPVTSVCVPYPFLNHCTSSHSYLLGTLCWTLNFFLKLLFTSYLKNPGRSFVSTTCAAFWCPSLFVYIHRLNQRSGWGYDWAN